MLTRQDKEHLAGPALPADQSAVISCKVGLGARSREVEQEEKLTRSEDSRWHPREERGEDSQPAAITAAPAWDGSPGLGE